MFKSKSDFDKEIYDVLVKITDGNKWDEKPEHLLDIDFADVLEHIADQGLIKGLEPGWGISKANTFICKGTPRTSHAGLSFMERWRNTRQ